MLSEQHPRCGEPRVIAPYLRDRAAGRPRRVRAIPAALLILSVISPASGQHLVSGPRGGVPLARHVPASANLFITIRRLDEVDAAMHRARAWHLLPMLAGNPMDDDTTFDLRKALTDFIGPNSSIRVDDLMRTEIGIVAPSWLELAGAVWLVRLTDESVVEQWFPEDRHKRGDNLVTRFFRTGDDMLVCVRDEIAAIAHRRGSGPLLHETMLLMAGRRDAVLEQAPEYQQLLAYLPARPLAVAYVNTDGKSPPGTQHPSPLWPEIDRAVVGLYEGDGRIDFAVRASLGSPESRQVLSGDTIQRLVHLPQTTLFATAITLDFGRTYEAAVRGGSTTIWGRLLTLLTGLRDAAATTPEPFPQLGPHIILVWDQDLRGEESSLQAAVMVECSDARKLCDEASVIANGVTRVIQTVDTVGSDAIPTILQKEHLGTNINYVPLDEYALKSRFPSMHMLGETEPAWAALGENWFVFALSRDHIERILEARHGLIPTLSTVRDVQALSQQKAKRTALSIVQADLAADVLERWLKRYESGEPSLLDPRWWADSDRSAARKKRQLGIGMKAGQQPGVVAVARVYPKTAADGRLLPGDRIIGIDGRLLDLDSPNADLRKGWIGSKARPGPTLRVQRGDTLIDVVLPRVDTATPRSTLLVTPADAVRELASLARTLEFASFASFAAEEKDFSARISLRLATTPKR